MTEKQLREEICRIGKSLFERGYVHATAGNISVRLDETLGGGFLITPTDACLGFLEPDLLARLDAEGKQIDGMRASKTIALHMAIYRAACRTDASTSCIIHSHSTHCVALSLRSAAAELLPALTPYFVMKVGHVPNIAYARPGAPEAAEEVLRTISRYADTGSPIRAVMLERLGPVVWHDTPASAMAVLEELEETARLAMLVAEPKSLNQTHIDELRQTFGARW